MNVTRIFLGGLAAAIVMCVLDALTNGVVFAKDWNDAYAALHLAPSNGAIAGFWFVVDLVCGQLIAFLYAAMRPRLGAGALELVSAALGGIVAGALYREASPAATS